MKRFSSVVAVIAAAGAIPALNPLANLLTP